MAEKKLCHFFRTSPVWASMGKQRKSDLIAPRESACDGNENLCGEVPTLVIERGKLNADSVVIGETGFVPLHKEAT